MIPKSVPRLSEKIMLKQELVEGGFASLPTLAAAWKANVKSSLHEKSIFTSGPLIFSTFATSARREGMRMLESGPLGQDDDLRKSSRSRLR